MPRVGDYELGRTVGRGAYSKVKMCQHVPTGKEYVAKIVPKTNRDVEHEIRVEIGILRRVNHPNVVQLIEILESPRNYYIILEAVLGGDLCDAIMERKEGLPENQAKRYFLQLLSGIGACHSIGVAHRDLKPENLLLTPDKLIKISDFGLSRLHSESHGSAIPQEYAQTLTGTLAYVAPEVLLGKYDAFKADLWSLGCILYVMVTCRFPFGSATEKELEDRIKKGAIVPVPDFVSPEARDLIGKLIAVDPDKRVPLQEIPFHPWISGELNQSFTDKFGHISLSGPELSTSFGSVEDPTSPSAASPKFSRPTRKLPGT
jgi:serine/threonine protein kinase